MEQRHNTIVFKNDCESGYCIKIDDCFIDVKMKDGIPCISKEELGEVLDHKIFSIDWFRNFLNKEVDDGLLPLHELEDTLLSIDKSNKSQRGFIYLISDGEFTKIGLTDKKSNIRMASLQTGNARELTLVGEYETKNKYAEEKRLHNIFRNQHVRGEWFNLTHSDIKMILLSGDAEYKEKESYVLNQEQIKDLDIFLYTLFKEEYQKYSDVSALIFKQYFHQVHGVEIDIATVDSSFFKKILDECAILDAKEKTEIDKKIWEFNYQSRFVENYNNFMKFSSLFGKLMNKITA